MLGLEIQRLHRASVSRRHLTSARVSKLAPGRLSYQQKPGGEERGRRRPAVRDDLRKYRVEVVRVMITNIHLPGELMKTTQQKTRDEQEQSMFDGEENAEARPHEFGKTKAQDDQQASDGRRRSASRSAIRGEEGAEARRR